MSEPKSFLVRVGEGLQLRVLDREPTGAAERPVFVLIHGLASNARLWDGVGTALAELGYRSIAADLRGHGLSDKPDDDYETWRVADDVAALIAELGLDRPVVAGQSWGANVSVELAARHPGLTRGIVPVDGGFIDLAAKFPDWEQCKTQLAPPKLLGTPYPTIARWIADAHPNWPKSGIDGALACFERRSDDTIAPWLTYDRHLLVLRGLWEHRPADAFARIEVPVLWMPAESGDVSWAPDKRASVEHAHRSLRNSRIEWFSPADHDLHAQFPERVAALLVDAVASGWMS